MTAPDLAGVASALLTSAATALGAGAPTRQYRTAGIAAVDFVSPGCDSQLTVMVGPSAPGLAGANTTGRPEPTPNRMRSFSFTLELQRSVPTLANDGSAPKAADLDAAGAQHCEDFRTLDLWVRAQGWGNHKIPPALTALGVQQVAASTISTVGGAAQGGVVGIRAMIVLVI